MKKIIRITTVPASLGGLLKGQHKFMSDYFEVVGVSSSGNGKLKKTGEQEGIRVIELEMTRKITPLKDLWAVWRLFRIIIKEKPLIVHTHTPKAGTVGMLAAFLARVPHRLHTIAGLPLLEARGLKRKILDIVEKITYSCATRIYPNSFNLKEVILQNRYTSEDKLFVIGNGSSNGIDTSNFNPNLFPEEENGKMKKELGISDNDFVFIYVGRFVKDKGMHELIGSFDKLSQTENNVKLLMVGSYERELDPLNSRTEELIHNHKAIIPVGWQYDVRPYFVVADCLVFPSYREGFPNVVMQAGAMGLFSIVSDINGCNEIVIDGKNGIIIPPKNESELATAMKKVIDNKKELLIKRQVYRDMITQRYEQAYVWKELLNEYKRIISV